MPVPGTPDVDAREAIDDGHEPTASVKAHVHHPELTLNFKQEEGGKTAGPEPILVLETELDDLVLGQAELIQTTRGGEELVETAILHQLVDSNRGLGPGFARDIKSRICEVWADVASEDISGVRQSFGPICLADDNFFTGREKAEEIRGIQQETTSQILFQTRLVIAPPISGGLANLIRPRQLSQNGRLKLNVPSEGCTHDELFLSQISKI